MIIDNLTILICFILFILGYILGSIDSILRDMNNSKNDSFIDGVKRKENVSRSQQTIEIDEKKFVTAIKTDGLESKSSKPLGDVHETNDDISSAASKLSQLKNKR